MAQKNGHETKTGKVQKMVDNDNNPNEPKYYIEEDEVQAHAPIVFGLLREYYGRLRSIAEFLNEPAPLSERLSGVVELQGVLPGKGVVYEPTLLDNDHFRVSVIFHMCISASVGTYISWEMYVTLMDVLENAIVMEEKNRPDPISPQSTILKMFKVSPSVLPKSYLQRTHAVDEFNMAIAIISDEVDKARPVTDSFTSYVEYYDYMLEFVGGIINELNSQGMFSTHEPERFAMLAISLRNNLPPFDSLYIMKDIERPALPNMVIRELQKKILSHTINLEPGEEMDEGMGGFIGDAE